jgi:hypothetical protein
MLDGANVLQSFILALRISSISGAIRLRMPLQLDALPNQGRMNYGDIYNLGYSDREGHDRTDVFIRNAAHAHDAKLRQSGVLIGVAGKPIQVRNPGASGIETKDGPFMSSSLPVAGVAIIEAASLEEAVDLVSQKPCAVAYGVVEVWPLN